MRFILILILILSSCTLTTKKRTTQEVFSTEKIHWYQYYQIIKISKNNYNNFINLIEQKSIEIKKVHVDSSYVYFKISHYDYHNLKQENLSIETVQDFPFIWWDNDLTLRKNSLKTMIEGYKDYESITKIIFFLKEKYPQWIRIKELGKSYNNKSIYLVHLTNHQNNNPYKIPVYFNALHHGNELLTIEYILDMIFLLLGESNIDINQLNSLQQNSLKAIPLQEREVILNNLDIFIIPVVNPDGLDNFWYKSIHKGRKNYRNVDLNRNYPIYWNSSSLEASSSLVESYKFRGFSPGSEKEVQYIMNFLKNDSCNFAISYHTYANKILIPYTIEHLWNPIPDRALYFAKKILQNSFSYRTKNYELARKLYAVDGTDQDWIYNRTGCIAYIVEGSMNLPEYSVAKYSIIGLRPIWYNLLKIALEEPRIELEFFDNKNQPIKPDITINNYYIFEKESFSFYKNRWIFYLGPNKKLDITIKYKNIEKNLQWECLDICREKIYLTNI